MYIWAVGCLSCAGWITDRFPDFPMNTYIGLPDVPATDGLPSSWLASLRGSAFFEYLRLNHVGHHVASGKVNYNVCCPGMDHVVGTYMPVADWTPMVRVREIKQVEGALAGSQM